MLFKGRLRLPGDAGEGIPIDLTLEDVYLTLDSNGEGLGEWRLDVVEISRLFSNQFSLLLDGEEMVFVAADALGFAYEGLSFVEEVQSRLKKRRFFKGRKPKRSKAKPASAEPQPEPEAPARSTPSSAPVPELSTPEVRPFFPEAAEARMAGDQDAPTSATSEPSPIAEPEVHAETPRRSLHPLGDPDEVVVDAYLDVSTPTEEPPASTRPAPPAPAAPDVTVPEVPDTTPDNTRAGSPDPDVAAPAVPDDGADDELVIEDVNPYGYQSPMSAIPEREARSDPERAAETPPTQESTHLVEPEPEPEPTTEVPVAEQAVEPMVEDEPQAPQVAATAESPTPEPIASAESSSEEATGVDMDHVDGSEPDEGPKTRVTQRTGRHAKGESGSRSSFFGRRRSKDPDPHDHVYESSKTVGGITRRICSVCGHVSFAGEDVYQDW